MFAPPPTFRRAASACVRGVTLVEMLVAVGLVGILLSLIVGSVGLMRERAGQTTCLVNLRQAAAALLAYTVENQTRFPFSVQPLDRDVSNSPNLFWPDILVRKGYAESLGVFFCPKQTKRPQPLFAPYVGYGVNRYGLMPHYSPDFTAQGYEPVSTLVLREPHRVMMLAESETIHQPNDGWYEFWAAFSMLSQGDDQQLMVVPRHGGRASIAFADGHVESLHVRKELYGKTADQHPRNYPWVEAIYTKKSTYQPK